MTTGFATSALTTDFERWSDLLDLISSSFAYMDGIIDPPSSAKLLTVNRLKQKALQERCFIAEHENRLIGCIFCSEKPDRLYVGKLAVASDWQGKAVGRALMDEAEKLARELGKPTLELETRIELTGNHVAFGKLGFIETARNSHAGYDRHTSITMRKQV